MNTITVTELEPYPGQQWKCGDEYLPFHPQASHVPPEYRDGWNRCYWMAVAAVARATQSPRQVEQPSIAQGDNGSPSKAATDLQQQIMSLPVAAPESFTSEARAGYKWGYRDARLAAAELVEASPKLRAGRRL